MGVAIDTILYNAVNPGAGPTAATTALSGDPASFRAFAKTSPAFLDNIIRMGTTAGFVQVRSPMFHDVAQGIRITPAESPSVFSVPAGVEQNIQAQDTPIVELSGGAAESDIAILSLYYTDLSGANARLRNWSDIAGNIESVKPVRIAVTTSATVGAWADFALTTTENLLHANTDYAIVGYMSNAALGCIAVRGTETSNLRAGGPGSTQEFPTSQYFKYMNEKTGRPYIPIVNAANAAATFVSVCAATVSVAAVVELILLEMAQPVA